MKLEDQVCSLESGKRLQELGITIPAYFGWYVNGRDEYDLLPDDNLVSMACLEYKVPAYTVAELGEMMPVFCQTSKRHDIKKRVWMIQAFNIQANHPTVMADTEAEARALMLIWWLNSGRATAEEINKGANHDRNRVNITGT